MSEVLVLVLALVQYIVLTIQNSITCVAAHLAAYSVLAFWLCSGLPLYQFPNPPRKQPSTAAQPSRPQPLLRHFLPASQPAMCVVARARKGKQDQNCLLPVWYSTVRYGTRYCRRHRRHRSTEVATVAAAVRYSNESTTVQYMGWI